jgi:hypothetical protein
MSVFRRHKNDNAEPEVEEPTPEVEAPPADAEAQAEPPLSRRAGIWDEVRGEIATALRESGGSASDAEGPYGTELHASVPTEVPGQGRSLAPARFVGVDGPRWFLRALLTGPAATDAAVAEPLLTSLKACVVVRGGEAMAVRDPLPLRLPKEVTAAAEAAAATEGQAAPVPPPERGPEITEIR